MILKYATIEDIEDLEEELVDSLDEETLEAIEDLEEELEVLFGEEEEEGVTATPSASLKRHSVRLFT